MDETTVADQYRESAGDDLRILVVGAGIAGITVAQLLRRQGRHPVLIDRSGPAAGTGYMLALMPMVDPVLDRLGVRERYRAASTALRRYGLRDRYGRRTRLDSMGAVLDQYGDYRGIDRGALLDVLGDGCPISHRSTVRSATSGADGVQVEFDRDPGRYRFDAVILADGMGSGSRRLVIGDRPVDAVRTGWSGWVVWIDADSDPQGADLAEELWGTGFFLGSYPVLGRIGVFLGGPDAELDAGRDAFVGSVRRRLREIAPRTEAALTAVQRAADAYRWPMTDARSPVWTDDRLVLLGDAAAGFLPTAGIGAGMAIESAAVLAAALRSARPATVAAALTAYEQAQRPRVEAAQLNSRRLAQLMFRRSRLLAVGRDLITRFVDVGTAIKPIQQLLRTPPAALRDDPADQAGGPSRSSGSLR